MCTSIVSNRNKTIVGFNLDIVDMEYRIEAAHEGVYIEISDAIEGWLPLFGVNDRGDFVAMPTCWPYDEKSDPKENDINVINLDIDLLLKKKTFLETKEIVETKNICSVKGITFQSQLTDKNGNVLQVIPGQGYKYFEKPKYKVMANFSPFKMNKETHPWMGYERYELANKLLEEASEDFDVEDCFKVLVAVQNKLIKTLVSIVYDASENKVYWCENCNLENIQTCKF